MCFFLSLFLSPLVFEEQGNNLIKAFRMYSSTLLNEADRDVSFASNPLKKSAHFIKTNHHYHYHYHHHLILITFYRERNT